MKLRLDTLKIKSFITDSEKRAVRAGLPKDIDNNSPRCAATFWEGCEDD
ncbi:MAG: pinensin family lanthipeptide [Acidobacteriota bacterium]|nr:pinensin family lanthipeptide [Acidobacteriota bacterium]